MNSFSSSAAPSGESSPSFIAAQQSELDRQFGSFDFVGEVPHDPMTDEEREEAIRRAGDLMERRYAVWASEGCFAALGEAHKALKLMQALVAGRSAVQVARMEAERGLA